MSKTAKIPDSQAEQPDYKVVIAVPARLGSTRLPRKPLALLNGKPLVTRVAQRVEDCAQYLCDKFMLQRGEILTLVATDSAEIAEAVRPTGVITVMTASELPSGTDRIRAAILNLPPALRPRLKSSTVIINLQGDEPFFHHDDIHALVAAMLSNEKLRMGTLAYPQIDATLFLRSSVVKVVCECNGNALYFSRSPIPWPRDHLGASQAINQIQNGLNEPLPIPFLQHVGVYAFRLDALEDFTQMQPSRLELMEGLEQLRAVEAGWTIKVVRASEAPFGIDTPEDLLRAEAHFSVQGIRS